MAMGVQAAFVSLRIVPTKVTQSFSIVKQSLVSDDGTDVSRMLCVLPPFASLHFSRLVSQPGS